MYPRSLRPLYHFLHASGCGCLFTDLLSAWLSIQNISEIRNILYVFCCCSIMPTLHIICTFKDTIERLRKKVSYIPTQPQPSPLAPYYPLSTFVGNAMHLINFQTHMYRSTIYVNNIISKLIFSSKWTITHTFWPLLACLSLIWL